MNEPLTCPTCSTPDLAPDDMCQHRKPLCDVCCRGGEHHWMPRDEWDAA